MPVLADQEVRETERSVEARRRPVAADLGLIGAAALVVSPIVIACLSIVGDTWYPAGDWAALVHRVSLVGSGDTPLIGAYSVDGWAHPGPLGFWLSAPAYWLTGEDPRALMWTAGAVSAASAFAICWLAWRRGRWLRLAGVAAWVALLINGIDVDLLINPWNPFLGLMPFTLVIFLAWEAAHGQRWALLAAVPPASLAMQSHFAFVPLVGVVVVWLVVWERWLGSRFGAGGDRSPSLRALWSSWRKPVRWGIVIAGLLWLAPAADAVVGIHNPLRIAKSFGDGGPRLGLVDGVSLVGRHVRPDGPWMGGPEPTGSSFSMVGSGPFPLLVALALLVGSVTVARRRGWGDVGAWATLALVLLAGAVVAATALRLPTQGYLIQWLKIVGGVVWLTVGWTAWRVADHAVQEREVVPARVRRGAAHRMVLVAASVTAGAVVMSQWDAAASHEIHENDAGRRAEAVYDELEGRLPEDATIRVVLRGDYFHIHDAAVFYQLAQGGHDVVTDDGGVGLKWGRGHHWEHGDSYDLTLTVAINDANDQCLADPHAEQLVYYDGMSQEDRDWLREVQFRRMGGPDAVTGEEMRRARALADDNILIGVYQSATPCAVNESRPLGRPTDDSAVPVAVAGLAAVVAGGGWLLWRRRRAN